MNTTCEIFPATLLIERSNTSVPQAAACRAKVGPSWDVIGALLVLMIAITLVGLWGWTFVEWVRLTVDFTVQLNDLMVLR